MSVSKYFKKTFFGEAIRRLMVLGIICVVISALIGITAFDRSSYCMGVTILSTTFFVIAGAHIAGRLKKRSTYELYGSIPVSRKQIWGSYVTAAIAIGAAIILINAVATGINLGIQTLRGTSFIPVFDRGQYIVDIATIFVVGICTMNIVMIGTNLAGNGFGAVVAVFYMLRLTTLSFKTMNGISSSRFGVFSLLFPVMPGTKTAIMWAILIVLMIVLTIFSCKSFVNFRMESTGRFMRSRKTAIVFAVIVASCAGLSMVLSRRLEGVYISISSQLSLAVLALSLIEGIIVYLGVMLVQHKKFKKIWRELVYFPIAIGVVGIVIALGLLLKENANTIEFTPSNVAYVTLPGNISESIDSYSPGNDGYSDFSKNGYGTDGEEKVHIDSPEVIKLICESIEREEREGGGINDSLFNLESQLSKILNMSILDNIYSDVNITLKDGRHYTVSVVMDLTLQDRILGFDEYVDKAIDISRFEGGRLYAKEERFQKILPVFINEYNKLSRREKLQVYGFVSGDGVLNNYGGCYAISKDGSQRQLLMFTSLTPEATKMYIDLCNEFTSEAKYMDFVMQNLYSEEFGCAECMIGIRGFCTGDPKYSYTGVYESWQDDENLMIDEDFQGTLYDDFGNEISREEYIRMEAERRRTRMEAQKGLVKLFGEIYASSISPWESDYVISMYGIGFFNVGEKYTLENGKTVDWVDYYNSIPHQITGQLKRFVGVTEEQYMKINELINIYMGYPVATDVEAYEK